MNKSMLEVCQKVALNHVCKGIIFNYRFHDFTNNKVKLICLSFFNFFFILSLRKEETCSIEDLTFNLKSGQSDFFLKTLLKNIFISFALSLSALTILWLSTKSEIAFLKFNLYLTFLKNAFGLHFTSIDEDFWQSRTAFLQTFFDLFLYLACIW